MKRSPFGASSRYPERATVVTSFPSSIECRKTLWIVLSKLLTLSMNTTSRALRNSLNRPGASSATSSRDSSWRSYSRRRCSAQGDKPQRKHEDRHQERRGEQQDRPQPGRQSLAGGEPDDHLAIAIPARERQQHGHEQRDRKQDVEVEQRVEAEEGENRLRRDRPAGGAGEQAQYEIREQNAQQDQEKPDRGHAQFTDQAAAEHHDGGKILTFRADLPIMRF